MPGSLTISQIYKDEERSFLKHLKTAENLGEESLHKLRVNAKRLRSLFKFLEILSDHKFKWKKLGNLLAPVFKSAGEIRTCTLNSRLLNPYRSKAVLAFKARLKEKKEKEKAHFLEEIKSFDKKKFKSLHEKSLRFFKKESEAWVLKNAERYLGQLFSKIRDDAHEISNDEKLHDIRKRLKDVKTISAFLKDMPLGEKADTIHQQVKALEEDIGTWHDTAILVQELEKFMAHGGLNAHNNKQIAMLTLKLNAGNGARKKRITKGLCTSYLLLLSE